MNENYLKRELYDLIKNDTSLFEFIQLGSLDGIWYWDLESPENEWMSAKFWEILGHDPNEKKHLAREWQEVIFKEDLELAMENLEKHCADPTHPYDQIVRYTHKNGSTVWVRCRGLAIRNEQGKAIRMLGAHTDITDLKNTEKELERSNQTKVKLFSIIAHDLRTPFNGLLGITEILADEEYHIDEQERQDLMKNLHASVNNAYNLLTNLLDWAHLNLERIDIRKKRLQVFQVISSVCSQLRDFSDQKEIEIRFDGDRDLEVLVDQKSFELVVRNLLTNAIKYSYRGSTVIVNLTKEATLGRISIEDSGKGMSETHLSSVLSDYYHVSRPGTEFEKGSGLGLSLAKEFVALNDGSMTIHSRLDQGTTAVLTFPLIIPEI